MLVAQRFTQVSSSPPHMLCPFSALAALQKKKKERTLLFRSFFFVPTLLADEPYIEGSIRLHHFHYFPRTCTPGHLTPSAKITSRIFFYRSAPQVLPFSCPSTGAYGTLSFSTYAAPNSGFWPPRCKVLTRGGAFAYRLGSNPSPSTISQLYPLTPLYYSLLVEYLVVYTSFPQLTTVTNPPGENKKAKTYI